MGERSKSVECSPKRVANERGIFEDALADDLENPPQVDAIPQQTTAASRFAVDPEGRLDLITDTPSPDGTQRELYQEVRHNPTINDPCLRRYWRAQLLKLIGEPSLTGE